VNDGLKQAMKAASRLKVSTLRLVNAAIKGATSNRTAGRTAASARARSSGAEQMIKQRRDSLAAYEQAGRA
jgi:uncharacterized protein YqeY